MLRNRVIDVGRGDSDYRAFAWRDYTTEDAGDLRSVLCRKLEQRQSNDIFRENHPFDLMKYNMILSEGPILEMSETPETY